MKHFEHNIHISGTQSGAVIQCYLLDMSEKIRWKDRPAVILCPGGAYAFTNDRESEPIAFEFLAQGYHVFSLRYSVAPNIWPKALTELAYTVNYIREHASEWFIDPQKIIIAGFSAGGHLAAEFACKWQEAWLASSVSAEVQDLKPNLLLLGYPVITASEKTHEPSMRNLLGDLDDAEHRSLVSLEKHVSSCVPPTFIWHTATDEMVPVENSLLFAEQLTQENVPYELHIYPCGVHGLSLVRTCTVEADKHVNHYCGGWVHDAEHFIQEFLHIEK